MSKAKKSENLNSLVNEFRELIGSSSLIDQRQNGPDYPARTARKIADDIFSKISRGAFRYPNMKSKLKKSTAR